MKKDRMLIVLEHIPFPADTGGKIRTANIIRYLSKYYSIDIVAYSKKNIDSKNIDEIKQYAENLYIVYGEKPSVMKHLLFFVLGKSGISCSIYNKKMKMKVINLLSTNNYWAIWFERLFTTIYLPKSIKRFANCSKIIVDLHDVDHLSIQQMLKNANSVIKKIYLQNELKVVKKMEKKCFLIADKVVVVSKNDKKIYENCYKKTNKIDVCPNGINIQEKNNTCPHKRLDNQFLFVGSLDYVFNCEAIEWFLKEVWPIVLEKNQSLFFNVVGSGNPPKTVYDLMLESKNVYYHGRVDDINYYFDNYTCLVVPLLSGSGTRLKVLEAFSHRMPVISTL